MGFRFRKSIKVAPGVRLNLTGKGLSSVSIGRKGARLNVGKKGVKGTIGIPGTGIHYSAHSPYRDQSISQPRDEGQCTEPEAEPMFSTGNDEEGLQYVQPTLEQPPAQPTQPLSSLTQLVILILGGGLTILLAFSWGTFRIQQQNEADATDRRPVPTSPIDHYKQAIAQGMTASKLVQTAKTRSEWDTVAAHWQRSINLLETVPKTDPNHPKAQTKAIEYKRNLDYAQTQVKRLSAPVVARSPQPATKIRVRNFGTCSSFATHAEAQASLRAGNSDLDRDNDGIACENML
jgi:Protein of unknown function (DUF4236)/Excalibur calcium-binding domain